MTTIHHLYAHIPFCPAKCRYCAFVTHVGSLKLVEPYVSALLEETRQVSARHPGGPLETVYFGGGTPSLLSPEQIGRLIDSFDRLFGLGPGCEVTLEAHPATVDRRRLNGFRAAGATRLSVGAESFQAAELEALGRPRDAGLVLQVLLEAREVGFTSVSVDLMYGIPGQTAQTWQDSLLSLVEASPDHLSLYPLMIEPGTVFGRRWREGRLCVPGDEAVAEMYATACQTLREAGYEHYEVASWARPGCRCRHNLAYWHNREFYGVGVGAHGYLAPRRTENLRGVRRYVEMLEAGGEPPARVEYVDQNASFAESVMLRLRLLQDGLDLDELRRHHGIDLESRHGPAVRELTGSGHLLRRGNRLLLAEWAVPVANEVWSRLM